MKNRPTSKSTRIIIHYITTFNTPCWKNEFAFLLMCDSNFLISDHLGKTLHKSQFQNQRTLHLRHTCHIEYSSVKSVLNNKTFMTSGVFCVGQQSPQNFTRKYCLKKFSVTNVICQCYVMTHNIFFHKKLSETSLEINYRNVEKVTFL